MYPGYTQEFLFVDPIIWFSVGLPIAPRHYHWGWHAWGCNWRNRVVVFNHNTFISRSPTFIRRDGFRFSGGFRGDENDFRGRAEGDRAEPFDHQLDRGFVVPHVERGGHPGAFSGFDHGGVANQHSFRGQSSFGGGMHGGGFSGGTHGGFGGGMRGGGFDGGAHGGFLVAAFMAEAAATGSRTKHEDRNGGKHDDVYKR